MRPGILMWRLSSMRFGLKKIYEAPHDKPWVNVDILDCAQ